MTELLHKTLETVTTVAEQGRFTALAATYSVDRVNDRIIPGAFGRTIEAWRTVGKRVPLHWDHSSSAEDVIGWVDPATMRETKDGLYVEGQLDINESDTAREAWRSMKNGALSLSFGYLATKQRKAKDGVNELLELDVFEVSVVPAPANPDTRFLSLKGVEEIDPKALRKRTRAHQLQALAAFDAADDAEEEELEDEVQVDETKIRALVTEEVTKQVSEVEDGQDEELLLEAKSAPQDPLRKRCENMALALVSDGVPQGKVTEPEPIPKPEPLDERELRRKTDLVRLHIASG